MRLNFTGAIQTTYSDWGRTLVSNYPHPTFKLNKQGGIVKVYEGETEVGEFDFNTATGYILQVQNPATEIEKEPNFHEFNIDTLIG